MEAKAIAKYVRISPFKVQRIVSMIRGRSVREAQAMLRYMPSPTAQMVAKVLNSAVANAENNLELDRDALVVSRAFVDKGPSTKRVQARARGRADVITKRSSHVTVVVAERGR
ncbi:MAG TPA: 50S ribosomal protein L22 [bacterium]|nr:50S ribosomal protein L22 [bacterium]